MESQGKNNSERKSSRSSNKIYYVQDSDCDERQAKHDAFLAESGSDFEEEIKRGKKSKFQVCDSDSELENEQVIKKKKKTEIPPKSPPKLVKNPFHKKKISRRY